MTLQEEIQALREQMASDAQKAEEERAALHQVVCDLKAQTMALLDRLKVPADTPQPLTEAWRQTSCISEQAARRRCANGQWRQGYEWFDQRSPGAANARIYLDIAACNERDRTRPSQRRPLRSVS